MPGPARPRVVALRARGALGGPRAVLLGPGDAAAVVGSADLHPPLAVGVHGLLSGDVPAARPARYGYRTAGICVGSVCVTAIRPAAHRSSSATKLNPAGFAARGLAEADRLDGSPRALRAPGTATRRLGAPVRCCGGLSTLACVGRYHTGGLLLALPAAGGGHNTTWRRPPQCLADPRAACASG